MRWPGLALGLALAGGCDNRLFLKPTHHPIAHHAQRKAIIATRVPLRGETIEAFYRPLGTDGRPPLVYVLGFSGNGGRAEWELTEEEDIFEVWLAPGGVLEGHPTRRGIGLVTINYPGYGGSDGPATLRRLGAAALDAYDYVRDLAAGTPIVVYGQSMGTTAALHIAASNPQNPPAGLVLDRGPDLPELVMRRYGWWNLWLGAAIVVATLPPVSRSVQNAGRITQVPALFILGANDTFIRPTNAYGVAQAYAGPRRVAWLPIGHTQFIHASHYSKLVFGFEWLWNRVYDNYQGRPHDRRAPNGRDPLGPMRRRDASRRSGLGSDPWIGI